MERNDDFNLYAYVGNDPLNGTDHTGKFNDKLMMEAMEKAAERYIKAGVTTQLDGPEPFVADAVGAAIAIATTVVLAVDVGKAILSDPDKTPADSSTERATRVEQAEGRDSTATTTPTTSTETITRPTLGADGATSSHIIERDDKGNTISVTHQVNKDGEVVHQHQTHIGTEGGRRQFPDEWVEYPEK